jgi:hypothetical protein
MTMPAVNGAGQITTMTLDLMAITIILTDPAFAIAAA